MSRRLRHQPDGAGDAGRDPAQDDVLRAVRPRREPRVPIPAILLDAAGRRRRPAGAASRRAFSRSPRRRTRSRRPWRSSPATPNSRTTPPRARARTPRKPGCRSSMTRPIRRPRPTTRRSCGRSRRPTPMSCSAAPTRPMRSAWCAPPTRSGSRRRCSAAAWSGCNTPRSSSSSAPQLNGIINYDFWEPAKTLDFPGVDRIPEEIPGARRGRRGRSARLLPAAFRLRQYAGMEQAVEGAKSLDQDKLAD